MSKQRKVWQWFDGKGWGHRWASQTHWTEVELQNPWREFMSGQVCYAGWSQKSRGLVTGQWDNNGELCPRADEQGSASDQDLRQWAVGSALGPWTEVKVRHGIHVSDSPPSPHQKQRPGLKTLELEQEPHWKVWKLGRRTGRGRWANCQWWPFSSMQSQELSEQSLQRHMTGMGTTGARGRAILSLKWNQLCDLECVVSGGKIRGVPGMWLEL